MSIARMGDVFIAAPAFHIGRCHAACSSPRFRAVRLFLAVEAHGFSPANTGARERASLAQVLSQYVFELY